MRRLFVFDLLPDERVDMIEVARFGDGVVVAAVGECSPNLALRLADSEELGHV